MTTDCFHSVKGRQCPISNSPCPGECIYSDVLGNITVGIIVLDIINKVVIFQNKAAIDLLLNTIPPRDYLAMQQLLLPELEKNSNSQEARSLRLGNKVLGYTVYHAVKRYIWIFIRDVTEREQAQRELRSAHRMTYDILENSPYGIFVVSKEGTIDYVNPTMLRIGDNTYRDFMQLNVYEIPAYRELGIADKLSSTLDGEPFFMGPVKYTSRSRKKTTIRNFIGIPLGQGDTRKALVFVEDITERKSVEEQNTRLAAAIESAAEAIIITDTDGTIQYVNPAFESITGYPREEAVGKTPRILKSGKQDDDFYRALWDTLKRGEVWQGRFVNKKRDGSLYNEEATISPIRTASGEIMNYVAVKRDVTEKMKLESVAEAVNAMDNIGYIFSGIRHEIGNPINSTKTALSVLRDNIDRYSKDTVVEYIERALSEILRVEDLLRSLKTFNMYENPHMQIVEVSSFLEKFLSLVRGDLEKNGITIKTIIHPEAQCIYIDPRALQQVMLNILTNASDAFAGTEDPKIVLSAFSTGKFIIFRVVDNGCGMTEKQQEDLFKPFYTTKAKGTGLGLAIVKKMLDRLSCSIDITSQKDAGTIVDITIPIGHHEKA